MHINDLRIWIRLSFVALLVTTTIATTDVGSGMTNPDSSRPISTATTPGSGADDAISMADTKRVTPVSVIIVGAGAASIKLAHTLWKQRDCCFRITIVEANDYIGGRVRNTQFEGHTVELGANWLSGMTVAFENPIWTLAQEIDLVGHYSDRENPAKIHVIDCRDVDDANDGTIHGGDGVITEEYLKQSRRFNEIYTRAVEHVAAVNNRDHHSVIPSITGDVSAANDVSVRTLLELFGWPAKEDLSDVERAVEHDSLEVWVTERLEELGAAHDMRAGANDVDLGKDELFVEDARGFNTIFRGMLQDLQKGRRKESQEGSDGSTTTDVLLEHEVQTISYVPGNVKVVAKDLKTGSTKELIADIVVSTVSLGVLQSGAIRFSPPLPDWKVQALNEIKMFNFGKVFVKLPKALWPRNKDYLVLVTKGEENRGHYPFWMRYKNVMLTGKNDDAEPDLMMCYLGGAQARRVELLSEEEIKDELEQLFHKAFARGTQSHLSKGDCRPVSAKVTDWSRNPRFCGSYSWFPKGAFSTIPIANLHRSLNGREGNDAIDYSNTNDDTAPTGTNPKRHVLPNTLYFAGEAFDEKFNGWIQGGYLSGERVGRSIIDACKATGN